MGIVSNKIVDWVRFGAMTSLASLGLGISVWGQTTPQKLKAEEYYHRSVVKTILEQDSVAKVLLRHAYSLDSLNPEIVYAYARLLGKEGQGQRSVSLLNRAYRANSTSRTYLEALINGLWTQGEMVEVQQLAENWLSRNPDDTEMTYLLGRIYSNEGKVNEAIRIFSTAQQEHTKDVSEYARLTDLKVKAYRSVGNEDAVIAEYEDLFRRFSSNESVRHTVINALIDAKALDRATELLHQHEALGADPSSSMVLSLYLYLGKGEVDKVKELLAPTLKSDKLSTKQKVSLLTTLMTEDLDEDHRIHSFYLPLVKEVSDQVIRETKQPTISLALAEGLRLGKREDASLDLILPLVKIFPQSKDVWDSAITDAVSLERINQLDYLTREVLKVFPREWKYYYLSGLAQVNLGKKSGLRPLIEQGIKNVSEEERFGQSRLWGLLADSYEEEGNYKKAFVAYDKALSYEQNNPEVLNNYAYALTKVKGGDLARAESMIIQALKLKPDDVNSIDTYAWILYLRGKYTLARLQQSRAIDKAGTEVNSIYYDHLGDIYLGLGEVSNALQAWEQALTLARAEADRDEKKEAILEQKIRKHRDGEPTDQTRIKSVSPSKKLSKKKKK